MWSRANLKENAKVAFKRNYWLCVLVAIIMGIASGGFGGGSAGGQIGSHTQTVVSSEYNSEVVAPEDVFDEIFPPAGTERIVITTVLAVIIIITIIATIAFCFFLLGPLEIGCCNFFKVNAYEKAQLNKITIAFQKKHYMKMALTIFLRNIYIMLWSFLLIIPGVIKSYEYQMIPYILADCPEISRQDAFRISKEMMNGNKMKAFVLDLSFFGWIIVSIITCGLAAVFYVNPYIVATKAEFFIAVREEYFRSKRG